MVRSLKKSGRGDRIRTCDICVPNAALYQAELLPRHFKGGKLCQTASFGKPKSLTLLRKKFRSTQQQHQKSLPSLKPASLANILILNRPPPAPTAASKIESRQRRPNSSGPAIGAPWHVLPILLGLTSKYPRTLIPREINSRPNTFPIGPAPEITTPFSRISRRRAKASAFSASIVL